LAHSCCELKGINSAKGLSHGPSHKPRSQTEPNERRDANGMLAVVSCIMKAELGRGHYTAYVLSENGRWWHLDDAQVTDVQATDIQTPDACILFYRRTDAPDKGAMAD
jgi:ubiquitin C-terminal hydrolase